MMTRRLAQGVRLAGLLLVTLFAVPLSQGDEGGRKILHVGWLLAVPGEAPLKRQSVLIDAGRIREVRTGYVSPSAVGWNAETTTVLDLKSMYAFPGFVDLHVHLTTPVEPGGALRVVTRDRADLALTAAHHAEITLKAGVTTVLDLGTGRREHEAAIYALKDAIAKGKAAGPRVLTVGSPISATGSARTGLYRDDVEPIVGPEAECDGVDACRAAVREQIKRGADVISFYNTGSLGDPYIVPKTMTDVEMKVIVETAHALNRPAVADGHNASGLNAALRAGADALVSATWPDDTTWKLLERTGAYFVSHIYAFETSIGDTVETLDEGTLGWLPMEMKRRLLEIKQNTYAAEIAFRRGIPMALGSDTGVIHHGDNAYDLVELVNRGMDPMVALKMATVNGAHVLRMSDLIGTIEAGKAADIIATSGNPIQDISQVTDIQFVMKSGIVFKR